MDGVGRPATLKDGNRSAIRLNGFSNGGVEMAVDAKGLPVVAGVRQGQGVLGAGILVRALRSDGSYDPEFNVMEDDPSVWNAKVTHLSAINGGGGWWVGGSRTIGLATHMLVARIIDPRLPEPVATATLVDPQTPPVLDRFTSRATKVVRLHNPGRYSISGASLRITGLPSGWTVDGATGDSRRREWLLRLPTLAPRSYAEITLVMKPLAWFNPVITPTLEVVERAR